MIKKFYMTMVAMLFGFTAMAQTEDGLYANEIKVEKGTTSVSFDLCLKNSMDVAAVSFRLGLPDGVGMTINKKGMKYITLNDDRMYAHASKIQDAEDGSDMISIYDNNPFFENDGALATIPLTLTEEIAAVDGTYEVKLYNISVANPAGESLTVAGLMPTEFTFKLTVGKGNGINSINADDVNAPIYNVAGQRVSKAQKGIFIQNGKKIAVK